MGVGKDAADGSESDCTVLIRGSTDLKKKKRPTEVILSRHLYTMVVTILWYKITTGTVTLGLRTDGDRLIPLQFRYPEHMESQFPDTFFVSVRYWSLMLLPQKIGI